MRDFDDTTFYAYARRAPFGGRLAQEQIDGTNALFAAWEQDGDGDDRKLANILAQVFHETGGRMVPVRETFASSTAQAIARLDRAWAAGRLGQVSAPYWRGGWFGRGPIQVTHERNYRAVGEALGVDLVADPDKLLDPVLGARSTVVGMMLGLFTGKKLSDYFNGNTNDPVNARRVVNGTDKARLIATYHQHFLDAIKEARRVAAEIAAQPAPVPDATARPADVAPDAAEPDGADLKKDRVTVGGAITGAGVLGGMLAYAKPVLESINSPWAFAFAVVIAVGLYLVFTGRIDLKKRAGA